MSQTGIPRARQPGSLNSAAGPVPQGATVPVTPSGGSQWHPTVAHLIVILIVEIAAFAALRYAFRLVAK